jgi:two-component system, cell cycle sensor histidine kinase and response regulator CckA
MSTEYVWPRDDPRTVEQLVAELAAAKVRIAELEAASETPVELRSDLLDAFFLASPAGLAMWDESLRYTQINITLAEINGVPREDHLGRTPAEVLPKLAPTIMPLLERARTEPVLNVEVSGEVPAEPGTTRHWVVSYFPISVPGRPPGVGGVIVDITDFRNAEAANTKLQAQVLHGQKQESLGILAGGIAHDFNNLLVTVMGNADLALLETPAPSDARQQLQQIKQAAKRGAELCSQMLAYSGRGRFVVEHLDLNGLVAGTTDLLGVALSKRVTVATHLAKNLPAIEGDATQVRRVIMNLVSNAVEAFGDQDGVVTVITKASSLTETNLEAHALAGEISPGPAVVLEISDAGSGMSADLVAKMFDPFFTTKFTGRGLGLAAVQGIVSGHGGAIHVRSQPGEGTTMTVYFPAVAFQPARAPQPSKPRPLEASGTVLLADDEPAVRSLGKRILERLGFTVLLAVDGRDAVRVFNENAQDIVCIILDLTMPTLNGDAALREIRATGARVPIILSSGYDEQQVTAQLGDQEASAFLQKPYDVGALVEQLRRALQA